MTDIRGRTAFVTGGASGIGLAIAEALLAEGARVVLADIDGPRAEAQALRLGAGAFGLTLDVTDRAAFAAAKTLAEARCGPATIVVNNAGIGYDGTDLADMDPLSFDRVLRINLTGVFNGISAFAADLRARGEGHIVNTASLAGVVAMSHTGAYTASKFAVLGMTEVLHKELKPHGVGVSALLPGPFATRLDETTRAVSGPRKPISGSDPSDWRDPALVGPIVAKAIRDNALYIHTHPRYRAPVRARSERILAAFEALA